MDLLPRVIALGFFDGVHLGHAALLRTVAQRALELHAVPSALSFDVHPAALVSGKTVPLVNSPHDRVWLMKHLYGIQDVILDHFDLQRMHQPWQSFVSDYLVGEWNAVHLVAGYDYHFGDHGAGNADLLAQMCGELGIGCDIIGMVELDGTQIHSTLIRSLLQNGDIDRANRYLGHPHILSSTVAQGKHLGASQGFPTVNLVFPQGVLVPKFGVYAAAVRVGQNTYPAVANIGVRPTVEQNASVNAEAFLLDFSGDLYGETVQLQLYHYLRPERKFPSVDALRTEVLRNAEQTRRFFEQNPISF